MQGLKVGHVSNEEAGTGVSVFLFDKPAVGAYWICGSAPATHELHLLEPDKSVPILNALMLTGGSAYGLYAAKGIMTYLTEQGIGLSVPHGLVPIVPAAAIYDLSYIKALSPTEEDAYQACQIAKENNTESGRIGAGAGATVGKIIPDAKHMTGGIGRAELDLPGGIKVIAYAVVNSVGDIHDGDKIIAGAYKDGKFADCEKYLLSGLLEKNLFTHGHTTLVAVFTNAKFSKGELKRIARMATAGMARAITPIFTQFDGDMVFCISLGLEAASELTVGTVAAEAVRLSVIDAVKNSEVIT